MSTMNRTTVVHSTGVHTTGWAAFALLCLFLQGERGHWFWIGCTVCLVWMIIGVLILMGEVIAENREARRRVKKAGEPLLK